MWVEVTLGYIAKLKSKQHIGIIIISDLILLSISNIVIYTCRWCTGYDKDSRSQGICEETEYRGMLNFNNFNEFLCNYLGVGVGGRRCTNACICRGTHGKPSLKNRLITGRDEYELMCFCHICIRAYPGWSQNRSWGPFIERTSYSNWKAFCNKTNK